MIDSPVVQRLMDLTRQHATIAAACLALVVGFLAGRRRAYRTDGFQTLGEILLTDELLAHFGFPDYHLMNHITLRLPDGTTEMDHILVSRFGVFVIEVKNYKGWIFGDPKAAKWTQVLFFEKFRFQNPLFQNLRHIRAVQSVLDFLPTAAVKGVVVFTGTAEFKTRQPQGVVELSHVVDYIKQYTAEVMSLNRMQWCVGRLETARLAISRQTDVEHVQSLNRRHGRWH